MSLMGGVLPLWRDAGGVFKNFWRMDKKKLKSFEREVVNSLECEIVLILF